MKETIRLNVQVNAKGIYNPYASSVEAPMDFRLLDTYAMTQGFPYGNARLLDMNPNGLDKKPEPL